MILIFHTGSKGHLEQLEQVNKLENYRKAQSEQEIYQGLGLDYIEPELREGLEEGSLSASHRLPKLVQYDDLRGCLHNHTNYSDGINTLEEMALQAIQNESESLCIYDHSKSAFYANALSEERVWQQHEEIGRMNDTLALFRIFKDLERDIIYSGSLASPD